MALMSTIPINIHKLLSNVHSQLKKVITFWFLGSMFRIEIIGAL